MSVSPAPALLKIPRLTSDVQVYSWVCCFLHVDRLTWILIMAIEHGVVSEAKSGLLPKVSSQSSSRSRA